MKFTITGATGFIGRKLVSRLLRQGHEICVLGRNEKKARHLFHNAVEFQKWDPENPTISLSALRNKDAIIHLAGEGIADERWTKARKEKIYESRIHGTRGLVNAMKSLGKDAPAAFVCASAIGFYGDRGEEILTEESARGQGFLSDVCADWEKEAVALKDSTRTTVVRIGIVLGREGGALKSLLPLFRSGLGGKVGSGNQWMSWIHVDDLVSLLAEAATDSSYSGVFNGVSPQPVTNREFSKKLGASLGRPALLPAPAIAIEVAMGELAVVILSGQRVLPKHAEEKGFSFRYPDLEMALNQIVNEKDELERFQWFPLPASQLFPFFADEKNLEKITPEWLHFKVTGKNPDTMGEGCLIDYRLKVHGVPVRWQSRIEEWQPGVRFVDTQVKGPYRYWHHTHEFVASGKGTLMHDRVRYEIPRVPLRGLLLKNFVANDLEKIFNYRRERIDEMFAPK